MGTTDTIQFNEDFIALRLLARRIYSHIAKNHDGVAIPDEDDTVAPPQQKYTWPHDRAADLVCAWRIETHGRP